MVVMLWALPSYARVPTRLIYSRTPAASDCPDEAALASAVAARLGYEPFSPWGDQTILATITRQGSDLLGRAELIDHDGIAQGSREVRLARAECGELLLALALAISITLDPLQVELPAPAAVATPPVEEAEEQPEPPPEEAASVLAPEPPPTQRDKGPARSSASAPLGWFATAAAIGALELAPELAIGGRLQVGVRRGRWSLGAEAWGTLPSARASSDGGEVRIRLLAAALTPCLDLWRPLSLCALASLGALHAEGRGVDSARAENVLYASAGARALVYLPIAEKLELVANADVAGQLNRPRFQLNQSDVWRPGPVVASFGLGVATRFF
jgi:hypothetical protein